MVEKKSIKIDPTLFTFSDPKTNKTRKKEKGCVEPLFGKKSKCVIKIVPKESKTPSFQVDKKCIKKRK